MNVIGTGEFPWKSLTISPGSGSASSMGCVTFPGGAVSGADLIASEPGRWRAPLFNGGGLTDLRVLPDEKTRAGGQPGAGPLAAGRQN
jgi:hypothetical protein